VLVLASVPVQVRQEKRRQLPAQSEEVWILSAFSCFTSGPGQSVPGQFYAKHPHRVKEPGLSVGDLQQ